MSEIADQRRAADESEAPAPAQGRAFNPLDIPICTRTPLRYGVLTAWLGHVPFGMALMAMARPRRLVELGTHWGVSYCAFCQAVKELRLPTECFAVDTWEGDPHAGFYTNEVLDHLKAHHDDLYSLFSKLLRTTFDDALPQFADGSIDVLHIDGHHSYDAVMHDFETWLPKLSNRGVVLMHDIEVRDRPSFGVWRFWDEVKQHYPHFAFHHSYGLGVLAVGRDIPDGLRPLLLLDADGRDAVRRYFANLSDHLEELHGVAVQRENLQELLDAKSEDCARLEGDNAAANAELEAARRQHARIRYRAVDKLARIVNRIPVLPGLLHSVAVATVPALLRANRMISPRRD